MNGDWYTYQLYNHLKHFWRNSIVDRLNRHGIHWIQFPDTRIHHYGGKEVYNAEKTNELIAKMILSKRPCMISRLGGSEMKCITAFISPHPSASQQNAAIKQLGMLSGFFPMEKEYAEKFVKMYLDDMKEIDLDGVWRFYMEDYLVKYYLPQAKLTILEYLEPWRAPEGTRPWSYALKNQKVLVVHPFADTIRNQYQNNRTKIFDVAILGCGAYGLPLAARIKRMGKQAIHLGGATQLMFGIRGGRWDNTPAIARFKNDAWVTASSDETPKCAASVENGCYW